MRQKTQQTAAGSGVKLYMNGSELATNFNNTGFNNNIAPFNIGGGNDTGDLNGLTDEVGIWNRFLEHAGPKIPNLAGAKYTCETMADYFEASRLEDGKYDPLWGRDEMLLGTLAMGATGGVGSTYNTDTPLYLDLIDAFNHGDLDAARDLQAKSVAIINELAGTGDFLAALKSRLRTQGIQL